MKTFARTLVKRVKDPKRLRKVTETISTLFGKGFDEESNECGMLLKRKDGQKRWETR